MHQSSFNLMCRLIKDYAVPLSGKRVLDVGGVDLNGSYKSIFKDAEYLSLDRHEGVDIQVDGYEWPDDLDPFDIVISGQTLEHDPHFWLTAQNMSRVTKPGGLLVIIVPSKGPVHQYPLDCYRFLPDSMQVLADIMKVRLMETYWDQDSHWGDLAGVFVK